MAAPNNVDNQPAAGVWSSASPKAAGGHDPSESPDDRDPTRLLVEMLAGTGLGGMPMIAPNQVDQPQAAAAAAEASVSATAGHCPGVAPAGDDDLTLTLTKAFATTSLETAAAAAAAVANKAALGVSELPPVRASPDAPAAKTAGSRAERRARRRTRLRFILVPADYLRAGQESRDRSRRRELVRRCVGKLFSVHEDRARERGISAMMARLTTTLEPASSGTEGVSAAAPSPEHAGLVDLLEKMALSKKH